MADVFISYHENSAGELAEQIAAALDAAGISSWCARRDLPPGGNFARVIPSQIDACRVFLLLLNNNVYKSNNVENEVGMAFERLGNQEITILPFETETVLRKEWVRYYLIHIQSVKIPQSDPQRIEKLICKIKRILDIPPRNPEPTQPPANIIEGGECGKRLTYTLDRNGVLIISGMGAMWDYEWNIGTEIITTPWYSNRSLISSVRIQEGVTSIGRWAFGACNQLKSVTISDSVTYIPFAAFYRCCALTSIDIPNGVTSIGNSAFAYCDSLTSVTIPDSIAEIRLGAFEDCKNLQSVSVPKKARIDGNTFAKTTKVIRRP